MIGRLCVSIGRLVEQSTFLPKSGKEDLSKWAPCRPRQGPVRFVYESALPVKIVAKLMQERDTVMRN